MKRFLFRHYFAHLDKLTGTQRQQVIAALQRPDPDSTVPHQVRERERRLEHDRQSVHCGSKWERFQDCLRQRTTHQEAANRCDINYRTALRWRHRFLAETRELAPLGGVVEMDETFFAESAKGDRTLRARRPPRKRGGLNGKRGLSHARQ